MRFECVERLEPSALRGALRGRRLENVRCNSDRRLSISADRVRGLMDGRPFVAISGETRPDEQVRAFIDAVYWRHVLDSEKRAAFFVGESQSTPKVLDAVATLRDALADDERPDVFVNDRAARLKLPDLSAERPAWLKLLRSREQRFHTKPHLVEKLESLIGERDFRWHLTVHQHEWSGRLGGLIVCTVRLDGASGRVGIGKDGSTHKAAIAFRDVVGEPFTFDSSNVQRAADAIKLLAARRDLGDPEHHLEDQVLRERLELRDPQTERRLTPALSTSQFPAVWCRGGDARYTDLVLRNGVVPWIVELKVPTQGQGKYYRHAIGQAALYRAFVRQSHVVRSFFKDLELDPACCKAAVAFPTTTGPAAGDLRKALQRVADAFGVAVIEIPATAVHR